jgi:hypothetical protein
MARVLMRRRANANRNLLDNNRPSHGRCRESLGLTLLLVFKSKSEILNVATLVYRFSKTYPFNLDRFRRGFQRFECLPAMDDRHFIDLSDPQENAFL